MGGNFRQKSRMVPGVHVTDIPSSIAYSSVVLRDSVRILFMIAALNGLKLLGCDIQNAYLTDPSWEKYGPSLGRILVLRKGAL